MLKNPVLRTAAFLMVIVGIGYFGLVQCTRDNPIDPGSNDYVPGTPPIAGFTADTVTGFIFDSILFHLSFSDTQALGGKTPVVEMLYFNFYGNSANLNDSVSVAALTTDSTVAIRIFWFAVNARAYVRARDNDGNLSPLDSIRLIVDQGRPRLTSASASQDTVDFGDSVTLTASAIDTNGTIRDYVWTVSGVDTATASGVFQLRCTTEGTQSVIVRARDNDWVFSLPDTLRITVNDRTGPEIYFWSPTDPDTVSQLSQTIMVRTRDPSGIFTLWINGTTATRLDTSAYPSWQTWQATVTLIEGNNSIPVWSWDRSSGNNQTRDTLHLFYSKPDNFPPSIVFSTPQQGDTVRDTIAAAPVLVMVSVSDQSGVQWVRCNGVDMSAGSGNIYTMELMLNEGANALVITAEDMPGNGAIDTLNVTYLVFRDNAPPTMRIVTPQAGRQIAGDSVNVIVLAFDTAGAVESGVDSVTVNGARALDTVIGGVVHYMLKVPLVHGYDTIIAVAADSNGNQATDTVVVIQNALPQFYPDISVKDTNLWLDSNQTIQFVATDADNDTMVFEIVSAPLHNSDSAYMSPESPGYAHLAGYRPDSIGLDTFRVRVVDSLGGADTLKVSVMILQKTASRPYFTISTLPDTAILDSFYSVRLTAEDPNDSPLVYSVLVPPTPDSVSITGDSGLVTWTPRSIGVDTIVAVVSNGIPESDTLRWAVTVVLRNMPPALDSISDTTIYEGQTLQFTVTASDTNNDALRYSLGPSSPAGAVLDSLTGLFSWTPTYKQSRAYRVDFIVTERYRSPAFSDVMTITITVKDTNMAPIITDAGNKIVVEQRALTFTVQATDPNGDSVRFLMSGLPANAQIDSLSGLFTWVPFSSQAGVYPVTFLARDNGSPVMTGSVTDTITVQDTTIPVFDARPQPMDTILVNYPYVTFVRATDSTSDRMIYRKLIGPDSLVVNDSLGIVGWWPTTAGLGEVAIVSVTAEDHAGNRDTLTWQILVARWPRIFLNPSAQDTGFSVVQTRDGYAVCGTLADTAHTYSVGFFMTTDASGNPTGTPQSYPGSEGRLSLYSMQQTIDGGFIMCGTDVSASSGTSKLALVRTDPDGIPLWVRYYGDTVGTYPSAVGRSVIQTADGGFAACGAVVRQSPLVPTQLTSDGFAVRTDAFGAVEWRKIYQNGLRASVFHSIQEPVEDGGALVMSGEIRVGTLSTTQDIYLVKVLPKGDTLWTRSYVQAGNEVALSVLRTAGAQGYIMGGYAVNGNITRGMLMRVREGGDTLWVRTLPVNTGIASVKVTLDNDYVACGAGAAGGSGSTNGSDALLCRFSALGDILWLKFHGAGLNDAGFCVAPTLDGGFVCTGFATTLLGGTTTDIFLAKTDKEGDLELVFDGIH